MDNIAALQVILCVARARVSLWQYGRCAAGEVGGANAARRLRGRLRSSLQL
jgi:hypothetical protein